MPLRQRLLEQFRGTVVASHFQVNVAKVTQNGRVAALAAYRLFQIFLCFGKLVLLVIGPAKAIEVCAVVRLLIDRMLNQRSSFLEAYSAVRQHISVVVQHRSVIRIHAEYLAELLLGEVILLLPLIDCAQHVPGCFFFAGLRGNLLGFLGGLFGFWPLLAALLHLGHIDVDFLIRFIALKQSLEQLGALRGIGFFPIQKRERNRYTRVLRRCIQRFFRLVDGCIDLMAVAIGVDQ